MAKINVPARFTETTHEGAPASRETPEAQLRRAVLSCLLWERQFYEDGEEIAERITRLCGLVPATEISTLAIEARSKYNLRHVPLLLVKELCKRASGTGLVSSTLAHVIQRPDELTEFLAIYWRAGKTPLASQVKKGLALAFGKFNEYQLSKWKGHGEVKLRDALFLCHAKPTDQDRAKLYQRIAENTLEVPDTWEVALSSGEDKRQTFERLVSEGKLGALALLRNLRNMKQAGVHNQVIRTALASMKTGRVLPYRFITAARYMPEFEPELEEAMFRCIADKETIPGNTALLVDVSGSMVTQLSERGETMRYDAACGLAILARELCAHIRIFSFSNHLVGVPPRRGFALRDAVLNSQPRGGTYLGDALQDAAEEVKDADRVIVITDEQSHDAVGAPFAPKGYMMNVASYKNGVGYGPWIRISGFSEAALDFIKEYEQCQSR